MKKFAFLLLFAPLSAFAQITVTTPQVCHYNINGIEVIAQCDGTEYGIPDDEWNGTLPKEKKVDFCYFPNAIVTFGVCNGSPDEVPAEEFESGEWKDKNKDKDKKSYSAEDEEIEKRFQEKKKEALRLQKMFDDSDEDACGALFCMMAMAMGESLPHECHPYVRKYFEKVVFKKGKFKASQTAALRRSFVDACLTGEDEMKKKVDDAFGRVRG